MSTSCKRILMSLVVGVIVPTLCAAKGITIEAEDFVAHNNTGGQVIQSLPLSGCSGGYILIGLDAAGEWAEYDLSVTGFGHYTFLIKCRGDFGVAYGFRMIFTPLGSGTEQTVDFSFVGMGYG
jgi:hypothetical protein